MRLWHGAGVRVAGANIKAAYLFVAVIERVDGEAAPAVVALERFQLNSNLADVEGWVDFRERVRQFLAPHQVDRIALMETRSFSNWVYANALARVSKICAVMDASHVLGLPFTTERTSDVARTLKLQAASLQVFEAASVGLTTAPRYWTTGMSEAAAVATHALGNPAEPQEGS